MKCRPFFQKTFSLLISVFLPLLCTACFMDADDDTSAILADSSSSMADASPTDARLATLSFTLYDENGTLLSADSTDSAAAARMALPVVTAASEFTSFTLSGSTDGGFEWTELWKSSGTATSAYSQLTSASVAVAEGHWQFRLRAEKGGASYFGQTSRAEVVAGRSNALSFTLALIKIGADSENGTGSVKVSVKYPAEATKVTAGLYTASGGGFGIR